MIVGPFGKWCHPFCLFLRKEKKKKKETITNGTYTYHIKVMQHLMSFVTMPCKVLYIPSGNAELYENCINRK